MALNRESVIRAAEKYVSKGKLEHAIKEYRKVLAENPNDANTLNRVGDLYARIERFDEAVKLFSQIAEQYTKDGFFVKAIAIYKKIIKLDPSALAVYERLAELYYKQGLLNEARTQYQVLADYYQKHDNATSATTIYQKMSQMEPENPSFHLKLAELYTGQRLIDKAMREYRHLADILIVNGSVDEATQVYEKALEVDSSNLDFVREAVGGLTDNGHEGAAAKLLAKAIELNPEAREIAAQVGMGGSKDAQVAESPVAEVAEAEPATTMDEDDDVFTIDMDESPGFGDESTGFGNDSAYVPGDASPFGAAADTFDAPETSFSDVESSVGEVSFDSAPADETGGMGLGGDDDEVFTFDLDDDEIPSSQVMPPADLEDAPVTLDEGSDFEIDLELDADMDLGGGDGIALEMDGADEDSGTEELSIAADDDDGVFDLGTIDEAPEVAPVEASPAADEVEIDWSMDSIDDLDAGLAIGGDVQPVEVEELDLGDFDDVALDAGDETLPSAVQAEPLVEPFAPEDFQFEDAEPESQDVGDETLAVGDLPSIDTDFPEVDLGLESPDETPAVDLTTLAEEADAASADLDLSGGLDDTAMVLDLEEEEAPAKGDTTSIGLDPAIQLDTSEDLEDGAETLADDATADDEPVASEPEAELSAVQREEDLLAEATVFAKYGLKDKALDRLQDLQNLHPDHPGGLELELRLQLEGGEPQEITALANRLLAASQVNGGSEHWDAIQEELEKAGFQLVDGDVVHQPEPEQPKKASGGDRIAQLLEDLSLEDLGSPSASQRPAPADVPATDIMPPAPEFAPPGPPTPEDLGLSSEDPTVSISRDALADAMQEVTDSVNEGAATAADLLATPETETADTGKKLFSLADELDLDDLDDDDEEVAAAPEAPAPAEPEPVDAMDETGMSWLDDVATESPQASQQVETIFDEEDDFFDLAAELERELSEEELAADDGIVVQPQEQSLEEIIEGFKQGVAENLSPEDYDTHYNLGIAYREMGLVDEAIGEFQLACKDDRYLVDCSSMLGQCFLEKGLPELAVRWYRKGLESPSIADEVSISLLYEMANAYLSMGDQDSAYKTFVEIYGLNSNYRDVANKLQELQGAAPS